MSRFPLFSLMMLASMALVSLAGDTKAVTPFLPDATSHSQNLAGFSNHPYEVRLRKLHLVRPDLIPYPSRQEFFA